MISLLHLNKLIFLITLFIFLISGPVFSEDEPADIWKDNTDQNEVNSEINNDEKDETIESPILSENLDKKIIKIDESEIEDPKESIIGIFDPKENNFNLNMWAQTDGEDIKRILKRINKLSLSKLSEDLLFQVLFTNAYAPKVNLSSEEFLKIKINWLIKKKEPKIYLFCLKAIPK